MRSLRPVAFHEAGHAVLQTVLRIPFVSVYIRADGSGQLVGTGQLPRLGRYDFERHIIATLAGPYAEARATKRSLRWTVWPQPDYHCAGEMMEHIVRTGLIADMDGAHQRFHEYTQDMLGEHWPAIERVATALIAHREITPGAVAALAGLPEVRLQDGREAGA